MELHEAAQGGDVGRVRELLERGADVDALDRWENTPLLLACFSEVPHLEVAGLLREHGADPHRRNIHGQTPRSQAHARHLLGGVDALADLPVPDPPPTDAAELGEDELAAIVAAVSAVVSQDAEGLARINAYDDGVEPYEFTHDYGRWGDVQLVLPPSDPRTWAMSVARRDDGRSVFVAIEMWTRQEGRSDLTLELVLQQSAAGSNGVEFQGLHVL